MVDSCEGNPSRSQQRPTSKAYICITMQLALRQHGWSYSLSGSSDPYETRAGFGSTMYVSSCIAYQLSR
jgi:hypothetical protein